MYYFCTLMIGTVVAWLELRQVLQLVLGDSRFYLDPQTAGLRAYVLSGIG